MEVPPGEVAADASQGGRKRGVRGFLRTATSVTGIGRLGLEGNEFFRERNQAFPRESWREAKSPGGGRSVRAGDVGKTCASYAHVLRL